VGGLFPESQNGAEDLTCAEASPPRREPVAWPYRRRRRRRADPPV